MKIVARVKTNSREESVTKISENEYAVRVKVPPVEGKANRAVVEVLSEFFHVPKSRIGILRGHKSKIKLIEIII